MLRQAMEHGTYRYSSWLYARVLGVVLWVAFVSLAVQAQGLFGDAGIAPIGEFVQAARGADRTFWDHPSILWFFPTEPALWLTLALGVIAATALTIGILPKLSLLIAWATYLSVARVGWPFMNFQWDTLLLEVTFTSIFFVPWSVWDRLDTHREPHWLARWALWWLLMRLVFRSALVKLNSGDTTWADLTALTYHYWTQPLPTVFAWYAHHLPLWVHKLSCAIMFAVEFFAPVLLLVPRLSFKRVAALSVAALMMLIIVTGNYGFFNLLTSALCLCALDDAFFRGESTPDVAREARPVLAGAAPAMVIVISTLVFVPSVLGQPQLGLLRPLDGFDTFNNYGLFAVMTKTRPEIILEGSVDGQTWHAYEFRYKPGDVARAPRWNTPHHPRLDWQMWFAALGDYRRNRWLLHFMRRLVAQEPAVTALLANDPFKDAPPQHIRAVLYDYRFTTVEERALTGRWWSAEPRRLYAPVVQAP